MKLLVTSVLAIVALGLSSPAVATTPAANELPAVEPKGIMAFIDGIAVPFKVHMSIQLKYQGHAVTEAKVVDYNGEKAYRLRVDRDDIPDDYNSIYLYYDMKWQLLDDKKITPPPKPLYVPEPPRPAPKPQPTPAPVPPTPPQNPEPTRQKPADIGGRGGDDTPKPEPARPDKKEDVQEESSEVEEKPQNTKPVDESEATSEEEAANTDQKDEA